MEDDFYEEEEGHGSSRKAKRLSNKRERLQVKNYLKGFSSKDIIDETFWEFDNDDDIENETL